MGRLRTPRQIPNRKKENNLDKERNLCWMVLAIPENCHNIFVCMDGELFDERVKNGIIPLHDERKEDFKAGVPCFIGYAPTADLNDLEALTGLRPMK